MDTDTDTDMDKETPSTLDAVEKLKKEDRKVALLVFLVFVALTLWVCLLPQEYKSGSALSHGSAQQTVPVAGKDSHSPGTSGSTELAPEESRSGQEEGPFDSSRR